MLVTPQGTIFVSDGHEAGPGHNARVMKFDSQGHFIKQWGEHGMGGGQFEVAHAFAMDREGHLYVGDRWNNRIQEFDQDGKLLQIFTQFGRPSGIYIDRNDIMYSTDSRSRSPMGYGHHPGWKRGIRIGSVKDGIVTAFIPDTDPNPDAEAPLRAARASGPTAMAWSIAARSNRKTWCVTPSSKDLGPTERLIPVRPSVYE